jgi:hypothetical protein
MLKKARGREARRLTQAEIDRLELYRIRNRYSYPGLAKAMAVPFSWETLRSALDGKAVWVPNHAFIAEWIQRYVAANDKNKEQSL